MFVDQAQSTMMTMLRNAAGDDIAARRQAIEHLANTYRPPLVDFLRVSKRISHEEAEDVIQSFWSDRFQKPDQTSPFIQRFLERKQAVPTQSFRKYLARSVTLHFISSKRKSHPETQVENLQLLFDDSATFEADDDTFDKAWANHFLFRVLERVRLECAEKDQLLMWILFEEHLLRPALTDSAIPGYAELADRYQLKNPKAAANLVLTMLRKFRRVIREVVADTIPHDGRESAEELIQSEITKLFSVLGKRGNLCLQTDVSGNSDFSVGFALEITGSEQGTLNNDRLTCLTLFSSETDLGTAWRQLLNQPIGDWLFPDATNNCSTTLADVVAGVDLDLETCDQLRSRAKLLGGNLNAESRGDLPAEFFAATYLIAIVAAQVYLKRTISTQNTASLHRRCGELSNKPWLDQESKNLLGRWD